jgi:cytochrome P450
MPEFKLIAGHFLALKKTLAQLPAKTTFHTVMMQLSKSFPAGIFYINLWPYSGTLMVVTTPSAAIQVQNFDLEKPSMLREPLDNLTGGPSLLTMGGTTWKKWRTLFNPGFSPGYLIGLAPAIADEVAILCSLLRERARQGKVFQLEDLTLKLTVDVIGSVTL